MTKKKLIAETSADIKKAIENILERKRYEKQALLKVLNFFDEKSGDDTAKNNHHTK